VKRVGRHGVVSGVLVIAFIVSCVAMQSAFRSGNRQLTLLFAVCCGLLCISSTLSIFLQAVRYVERRKLDGRRGHAGFASPHREYCATYSLKNRTIFSLLTGGAASFTYFAYAHPGNALVKILISALLLFCLVTLYRYFFTTVSFTEKLIVAELRFFTRLSESYETVTAMHAQPGNLRIEFADGKKLNIPSGLGNFAVISSILEKRVRTPPDFGPTRERNLGR
jgi:hypothetical protein